MKLINYLFPFLLAISLKSATLEYLVTDSLDNPLNNSTIVLQGINNPDYFQVKQTESNKTSFEVEDNQFFNYFVNKIGYKSELGVVYSDQDKQIESKLKKLSENSWYDYYLNNGDLEMSFNSFDEDIFYKGGEPFNYEIQFNNISDKEISFDQNGLFSFAYDSLNNQVNGWVEQNPDRLYNISLKKKKGWFKASVEGNDVTIYIGEAKGVLEGRTFDITGDGEYVSSKIQTNDNIVPDYLNGKYKIKVGLNYNQTENISLTSQDFFIENYIPNTSGIDRKNLENKIKVYPNPFNSYLTIHGENLKVEAYDLLGRKVYEKQGSNLKFGENLKSGIYFLKINNKKKKVIKLK